MRVPLERDVRTPRARARRSCGPLRRRAGSSGWDPSALGSKLRAWYRGDAGIVLAGGAVLTWQDQSGNGNDLTQAVLAQRPVMGTLNGLPCPVFVAASLMFMQTTRLLDNALFMGPVPGDFEIVAKARPDIVPAGAGFNGAMIARTSTSNRLCLNTNTTATVGALFDSGGASRIANAQVPTAGVVARFRARNTGVTMGAQYSTNALVSVASVGQTATNYQFALRVGFDATATYFDGPMGELLMLNALLTSTESALLDNWLLRWGPT